MRMNRLLLAAFAVLSALSVLSLGGCAGTVRGKAPVAVYDFGQPVRVGAGNAEAEKGGLAGRLALDVRAAPWLDGTGIDYRLAYGDPLRRSQYADSRWAAQPALLLAQQLRRQIGFAAVDSVAAGTGQPDRRQTPPDRWPGAQHRASRADPGCRRRRAGARPDRPGTRPTTRRLARQARTRRRTENLPPGALTERAEAVSHHHSCHIRFSRVPFAMKEASYPLDIRLPGP